MARTGFTQAIPNQTFVDMASANTYDNLSLTLTAKRVGEEGTAPDFTGQSISIRRPNPLPYHVRDWGATTDLIVDDYSENFQILTGFKKLYSLVAVSEDFLYDNRVANNVLVEQSQTIANGAEDAISAAIKNAKTEVTIAMTVGKIREAIVEADYALNALAGPNANGREPGFLVVAPDVWSQMLLDPTIVTTQWTGDANTSQAFSRGVVGTVLGYTVIKSGLIDSGTAYLYNGDAIGCATGAPGGLGAGVASAVQTFRNISMRWNYGADINSGTNRSHLTSYLAAEVFSHQLLVKDVANNSMTRTADSYVTGMVKLTIGGKTTYPAAGSDLAKLGVVPLAKSA